jgi:predicted RNase H-like HicB family nuclease
MVPQRRVHQSKIFKLNKNPYDILRFRKGNPMAKKHFTVIIERDPDGVLIASVPAIKGCHTQAKTLTTLLSRIKEAIELCCESDKDLIDMKLIGMQEVEVTV